VEQGNPLHLIETGGRYRRLLHTHLTRSPQLPITVH